MLCDQIGVARGCAVALGQLQGQHSKFLLEGLDRGTWFEPSHEGLKEATGNDLVRLHDIRSPELDVIARNPELRRHDAHDRAIRPEDLDRLAENVGPPAEPVVPERIRQHGDPVFIFFRRKSPSKRLHAECSKEVDRRSRDSKPFDSVSHPHRIGEGVVGRDFTQQLRVLPIVNEELQRDRELLREVAPRSRGGDVDQSVAFGERQRVEQYAINDSEHPGVDADCQAQRRGNREGKARSAKQTAHSEAKIVQN